MLRATNDDVRQWLRNLHGDETPQHAPKRRVLHRPEQDAQREVVKWARDHMGRWPELAFLFHPANGEYRPGHLGGILKANGVVRGVPDLILPVTRLAKQRGYPGYRLIPLLAIEMKSDVGTLSEPQRAWQAFLLEQGAWFVESPGAAIAIATLEAYIQLPRPLASQGEAP